MTNRERSLVKQAVARWRTLENLPKVVRALKNDLRTRHGWTLPTQMFSEGMNELNSDLLHKVKQGAGDLLRTGNIQTRPFDQFHKLVYDKLPYPELNTKSLSKRVANPQFLFRGLKMDPYSAAGKFDPGDYLHSGGFLGGAYRHGTPSFDIATAYAEKRMPTIGVYKSSPHQVYTHDFGLEQMTSVPRSVMDKRFTGLRTNKGTHGYETALTRERNPGLGTILPKPAQVASGDWDIGKFVPVTDKRSTRMMGNVMRELATGVEGVPQDFSNTHRVTGAMIPDIRPTTRKRLDTLRQINLPAYDQLMGRRVANNLYYPNPTSQRSIPGLDKLKELFASPVQKTLSNTAKTLTPV